MNRYIAPLCIAGALSIFMTTIETGMIENMSTSDAFALWLLQTLVLFWLVESLLRKTI